MQPIRTALLALACARTARAGRGKIIPSWQKPPDLNKNWLVHGPSGGQRAAWNSICRRYEARIPRNGTTHDVAVIIRSTWHHYCNRVLPSLGTWAAPFAHTYVVLREPNGTTEHAVERAERVAACPVVDAAKDDRIKPNPRRHVDKFYRWRSLRCGDEGGTPVVIAKQCRGASRCCEADLAQRFVADRLTTTFRKTKWFLFADDDVFVRADALMQTLDRLDAQKVVAVAGAAVRPNPRGCASLQKRPALAAAALSRSALLQLKELSHGRGLEVACLHLKD